MTNKLSDKDKKDWINFINSSEKLQSKDLEQSNDQAILEKSIDLHGFTLEEANKEISKFIENCYLNKVKKINVITGKGLRSKNNEDPYSSSDLGMLKNSVPDFIKNNSDLMNKIKYINFDEVASKNKGNFYIYLKKN